MTMTPAILEIGKIYFGLAFEDDEMRYPIVHSYEYLGISSYDATRPYEFRYVGSNDVYLSNEEGLEFISCTNEIPNLLLEWAGKNKNLAS